MANQQANLKQRKKVEEEQARINEQARTRMPEPIKTTFSPGVSPTGQQTSLTEEEVRALTFQKQQQQLINQQQRAQISNAPKQETIPDINLLQNQADKINQKYTEAGQQINAAAKNSFLNKVPGLSDEAIVGFEKTKYSLGEIPVKQIASEAYDTLHSAITRKKPLKYTNAKSSFDSAISLIKTNVDEIDAGKPYPTAIMDFENAANSLNRLEASSKGFAQENLNWWIDDGLEIQTEIELQKAILQDLRMDLNTKILNQRMQQNINTAKI